MAFQPEWAVHSSVWTVTGRTHVWIAAGVRSDLSDTVRVAQDTSTKGNMCTRMCDNLVSRYISVD